jgi:hypothetical protein
VTSSIISDRPRSSPEGQNHSHSIVQSDRSALIFQRKFFQHTTKSRLADPSEISALEFKGEFRRFRIHSVSRTIGINRSIFSKSAARAAVLLAPKKTVSRSNASPMCELATTEVQHGDGVSRAVAGGDCRAAKDLVWV